MATGSASNHIMTEHACNHTAVPTLTQNSAGKRVAGKPPCGDLLVFTNAKQRRWSVVGALSVITMDWQDF
ncbi:hypothetical protein [Kordiimonas sp.]|uniref:hypothetical protein n=1 Tax=Kordiimonas sp. TaxID=1970157 RepID=UPI003A8E625B